MAEGLRTAVQQKGKGRREETGHSFLFSVKAAMRADTCPSLLQSSLSLCSGAQEKRLKCSAFAHTFKLNECRTHFSCQPALPGSLTHSITISCASPCVSAGRKTPHPYGVYISHQNRWKNARGIARFPILTGEIRIPCHPCRAVLYNFLHKIS